MVTLAKGNVADFDVLDELGHVIGHIETQRKHGDCAKYFAWKGDRYLGQAETIDYCLTYFH